MQTDTYVTLLLSDPEAPPCSQLLTITEALTLVLKSEQSSSSDPFLYKQ